MSVCKKCGNPLNEDSNFCQHCGEKVLSNNASQIDINSLSAKEKNKLFNELLKSSPEIMNNWANTLKEEVEKQFKEEEKKETVVKEEIIKEDNKNTFVVDETLFKIDPNFNYDVFSEELVLDQKIYNLIDDFTNLMIDNRYKDKIVEIIDEMKQDYFETINNEFKLIKQGVKESDIDPKFKFINGEMNTMYTTFYIYFEYDFLTTNYKNEFESLTQQICKNFRTIIFDFIECTNYIFSIKEEIQAYEKEIHFIKHCSKYNDEDEIRHSKYFIYRDEEKEIVVNKYLSKLCDAIKNE